MDAVKEAQELFTEALDASSDQRRQIEEDLAFSDPSDPQQWDETIKASRENDAGGKRPCLTFDQIGQYISNVSGQIQQRPPAMHAIPVDSGADVKAAEHLDGFMRHIEYASRAQQHYSRALLSSARTGVGYLVVRPEYTERALNRQEPRIGSVADPLSAVFDPWSTEIDGSDATFGFLLTDLSPREFDRRYSGREKRSFGDREGRKREDREAVTIAEQWRSESSLVRMVQCVDLSQIEPEEFAISADEFIARAQADPASGLRIVREYKEKRTVVRWSLMSGADVLEEETTYPAEYIGIVPVYGYVAYADGRLSYCGLARRARVPQQEYNFHRSELHALMAQAPKAPWIGPAAAFEGFEALWDRAAVESRAYLPTNHTDGSGNPIPQPQRMQMSINLQNHIAGAADAVRDIQAALGMYQANLGAPSNETSGIAIEQRKEQGESSNAHFPMNLQASVAHVGRIIVSMLPKLLDKRRQVRIIGIDDTPGSVTIDPQQQQAMQETDGEISINPNIGKYDVRVVVGASFTTQRAQAQAALNEVMARNPEMAPAVAPIWAKTLDIPYADKLAQALLAVAPPEIKAVMQTQQKGPTVPELLAQLQEVQQAKDEAVQLARQAEQELAEKEAQLADKTAENAVREYEAETNRLKVTGANEEQIRAIVADLMLQMQVPLIPPDGGDTSTPEPDEGIETWQQ